MNKLFLALALLFVRLGNATPVEMPLQCVLNGLDVHQCSTPAGGFGTISLEDLGSSNIRVTVNLINPDQKFRDLVLNFNSSSGSTLLNDGDSSNTVVLTPNGFQITPYSGLFDIGGTGGQGWNGNSGYSTILSFNGTVTIDDLLFPDSNGLLFAALHIQNIGTSSGGSCSGNDNGTTGCDPSQTGGGSLKIGALGPIGDPPGDVVDVPEPGSAALLLAGLAAAALMRVRGRRTV